MDGRKALEPGFRLVFRTGRGTAEYIIRREIGRGGSCIVYDAAISDSLDNPNLVRIRECYPHAAGIRRMEDGSLRAAQGDGERFAEKKRQMRKEYELHRGLFCTEGLTNSITNTWDIHEANGTVYTVSVCLNGEVLAEHACGSLRECAALTLSTAGVLRKIHDAGYLYLDLKPENILTVQGTTELIQLFDFDSLVPVRDLEQASRNGDFSGIRVSYSKGFASPEQRAGEARLLGPASDVYGLGAVLFHALWGRPPSAFDREQDASFDYGHMRFPAAPYQDAAFRGLTEFFHHTLAAYPGDRYRTMGEAAAQLEKIVLLSDEKTPRIIPAPIHPPAFFTGREEDLEALDGLLHTAGHKLFSLTGVGGIGKSTLARAYLARHRDEYDAVVWMYDRVPVSGMIADDTLVHIIGTEKAKEESLQEYADRKARKLREIIADRRVLAVVDNAEPEHLNGLSALSDMGWDMLIISREALPDGFCPALRLGELQPDELEKLFVHYSRAGLETDGDRADFRVIMNAVNGHTLTVELLARQIAKRRVTLREAARLMERTGLRDLPAGRIDYIRDSRIQKATLNAVLDQLTGTDRFSAAEKGIMKVLSAFDGEGIRTDLFRRMTGLPDLEAVGDLEDRGWLTVNSGRITLHPLMREYIRTREWDENARQAMDTAMSGLYRMIKPEGTRPDSDRQYTENYGELYGLLLAAGRLIDAAGFDSAPKQRLKYRMLMDLPVDQDETVLAGILELLENPVFLDDGKILRLYENSAYLLGRLLRPGEALGQLEKMKAYLDGHQSTFFLSLYHRAAAVILHNSDMNGSAEESRRHIDAAIFAARVSRHPDAKTQLAACLLDKAAALIASGTNGEARELIREAEPLVLRYSGEYAEERYQYYCTAAMSAARSGDSGEAGRLLAEATRMADAARDSDLAYIDHLVDQAAWVYKTMGKYDRAAAVLREAIGLCSAHADMKRYYSVLISTWIFLDEIYGEAGEEELSAQAAAEVRRLCAESPWPMEEDGPFLMA